MFKNYLFLLAFCLIIFSSCQNDKMCNCPITAKAISSNDSIYTVVKKYWSRSDFWEKLNEPHLDTLKHEAYRVYLYSLFDDLVKICRVEKIDDHYQFSIKKYHSRSSFGGKQDSLPFVNYTYTLSKEKWEKIAEKMRDYCFWTMNSKMNKDGCLDESPLFLEANSPQLKCADIKPYHLVFGSCTDSLTGYKYFQLCDMLLDLDKE